MTSPERPARRGGAFLPLALAAGLLLAAAAVTIFLLPVSDCPSCAELVVLWRGTPPVSTQCSPCGNTTRVTPFVRWRLGRAAGPEDEEEFTPAQPRLK